MLVHFQPIAHTGLNPLLLSHTPLLSNHKQPLCHCMCCTLMAVLDHKGNSVSLHYIQPGKQIQLGAQYIDRNVPTIIYYFLNRSIR